jgi:hypothetical protein
MKEARVGMDREGRMTRRRLDRRERCKKRSAVKEKKGSKRECGPERRGSEEGGKGRGNRAKVTRCTRERTGTSETSTTTPTLYCLFEKNQLCLFDPPPPPIVPPPPSSFCTLDSGEPGRIPPKLLLSEGAECVGWDMVIEDEEELGGFEVFRFGLLEEMGAPPPPRMGLAMRPAAKVGAKEDRWTKRKNGRKKTSVRFVLLPVQHRRKKEGGTDLWQPRTAPLTLAAEPHTSRSP